MDIQSYRQYNDMNLRLTLSGLGVRLYHVFSGDELKVAEKIQQRRLQMLVNSYLYYKTDKAVVSDANWDKWAKELAQLQHDYPEIAEQVPFAEEFASWDGTTGEFLPLNEPWIKQLALSLVKLRQSTMSQRKPPAKLQRKLF